MEDFSNQDEQKVDALAPLKQITPLSKYLAMVLFIILPFLGGWVGYTYAPEKVVEVEKTVESSSSSEVVSTEVTESKLDAECPYISGFASNFNESSIMTLIGLCDNPDYLIIGDDVYYIAQENWGGVFVPGFNKIEDVEAENLSLIESDNRHYRLLATDGKTVFYGTEPLASASTFSILGWVGFKFPVLISKDLNGVYVHTEKIFGLDPDSATLSGEGIEYVLSDKDGECSEITAVNQKDLPVDLDSGVRHCLR